MQTPQTQNSQDQWIGLSDNITIPLQEAQVIPLSQSPSVDVNSSQRSHLDIEPLLNVQGPPSSSSHHIEQNQIVQPLHSSISKMKDQDNINNSYEFGEEYFEEKKITFEEQEKKLKEMKPFLNDFFLAEDYFFDVVHDSYKEGSNLRVLSDRSFYIQDDFVFNIEPKEWDNEEYFDIDKVRENIELFLSIEDNFNIRETYNNGFLRTRKINENKNERIPIKSNFCLRIYSLTGLQLISSYDLSISHLKEEFYLQVYDIKSLSIICDDFFYYIEFQDLMQSCIDYHVQTSATYKLIYLKDEIVKKHGEVFNVVFNDCHYIFLRKVYLKTLEEDIEIYPYPSTFIQNVLIQAFGTVIIQADYELYIMDFNLNLVILKKFFRIQGLMRQCKSKHLMYTNSDSGIKKLIKIVEHNTFKEIDFMTNQYQFLQQLRPNEIQSIYHDADADTFVYKERKSKYYYVLNYKDVENQFFIKLFDSNTDVLLFHSGNLVFTIIYEDTGCYVQNQTCIALKNDQAFNKLLDLDKATEIIDFKQQNYYKLRQINNLLHFQDSQKIHKMAFQQRWLQGIIPSQIKFSSIWDNPSLKQFIYKINKEFFWCFTFAQQKITFYKLKLNLEVPSVRIKGTFKPYIIFDNEILNIYPYKAVISETNQFILVTDEKLIAVILDLKNLTLIKSQDMAFILQTLTMRENQIVLVQVQENKIMINQYKIESNILIKKISYDLTQHVKQIDINNIIIPLLKNSNDNLKMQINNDKSNRFYYINELKNIIIFRVTFQSISDCYDYIIFDLDHFNFIGSFTVNKPLKQFNYRFYCVYKEEIYKTNIVNQLIDNFDLLNPLKLHVKIDVDLNKYEYYLNSQVMHFTQYEFKSIDQILINCLNLRSNLSDYQLISDIQNMSETDIFNYNQGLYSSFLLSQIDRSELVIEECFKRLQQINPRISPQICSPHLDQGTILDFCVQNHQYRKINIILGMIIKFNNNLLFNNSIDPHICYMLEKKINLKEYFESQLAYPQITSLAYPKYSQDCSVIFYSEIDKRQFTYPSLWNEYEKYIGKCVVEKIGQPLVEIQYNLINIPDTITNKNFIKNLIDSSNLEYYETEFIQTILDFKWERYAKKFFINQFYLYLVFLLSYVIDLYFFTINADAEQDSRSIIQQLVLKLTCVSYLVLQEYYELLMIQRIGFVNYLNDLWNAVDQALALLYFAIVIIDTQEITYNGIVIMQSCMLILIFIKLCEVLRVFQGFSYQVSMLKAVFMDLRFFIMLYAFVVIVYGLIFTLLKIKTSDENIEYDGISYFGYFIMAFRASTGDFQIDNLYQLEETHIIFAWIVWISAVLFLNIVLLNFIIAVISESYEKVMQKMVAESFKIKAELIQERESYFNNVDFQNQNYFPDYIIFRRPVEDQVDGNQEWQGFVKDIKNTIYKTHLKSIQTEKEILNHMKTFESTIKDQQSNIKILEASNKNQETLIKNQENLIKNLDIKIETLQTEMKTSVDQILKALQDKLIV